LWADTDTVIIVSGSSFADETAIAPYARASRTPILMTDDGQNLPESIALDLADNGVRKAILIGGNAVVSDGTMEMLENLGIQCMRLSGANRYLTTLKIFDWLIGADPEAPIQPDPVFSLNTTGFATGLDFADAITSANLLGTNKSPILLVADKDSADKAMFEALSGREDQVATAYIFGGTSAVSIRVECRIADAVTRDVQ
ncbi:MAG: cell wall-binding repeat-containing protein, partial [Lachnospiraceae bacterium]|nr:cell wall-binding repeat-containing protein [Lachnospiraceae bacterium]